MTTANNAAIPTISSDAIKKYHQCEPRKNSGHQLRWLYNERTIDSSWLTG